MASLYSSVSVANLEAFAGKDYSALDSVLTDGIIESMAISPAEVYAEAYTGAAPSSASNNPTKYGIMTIATRILALFLAGEGVVSPSTPFSITDIGQYVYVEDIIQMWKVPKQTSSQERTLWIVS